MKHFNKIRIIVTSLLLLALTAFIVRLALESPPPGLQGSNTISTIVFGLVAAAFADLFAYFCLRQALETLGGLLKWITVQYEKLYPYPYPTKFDWTIILICTIAVFSFWTYCLLHHPKQSQSRLHLSNEPVAWSATDANAQQQGGLRKYAMIDTEQEGGWRLYDIAKIPGTVGTPRPSRSSR